MYDEMFAFGFEHFWKLKNIPYSSERAETIGRTEWGPECMLFSLSRGAGKYARRDIANPIPAT
jgi:hypothetical protein